MEGSGYAQKKHWNLRRNTQMMKKQEEVTQTASPPSYRDLRRVTYRRKSTHLGPATPIEPTLIQTLHKPTAAPLPPFVPPPLTSPSLIHRRWFFGNNQQCNWVSLTFSMLMQWQVSGKPFPVNQKLTSVQLSQRKRSRTSGQRAQLQCTWRFNRVSIVMYNIQPNSTPVLR